MISYFIPTDFQLQYKEGRLLWENQQEPNYVFLCNCLSTIVFLLSYKGQGGQRGKSIVSHSSNKYIDLRYDSVAPFHFCFTGPQSSRTWASTPVRDGIWCALLGECSAYGHKGIDV